MASGRVRRIGVSLALWALAAAAAPARAQTAGPWAAEIDAAIGEHRARVQIEVLGRSVEGREIQAVRVRAAAALGDERRPTLVVVAGLDARHLAGTRLAIDVLGRALAAPPDALAHADLVVIPCANPDGAAAWRAGGPRADRPGNASRRTSAREDADRDRRVDEDGPTDLDGDGVIAQMRVKQPRAAVVKDLAVTLVAEADDPRLLRAADPAKGEVGEWAVLVEGRDQDGDGRIAEDGADGVDLDANFPRHWPEFDGRAGPFPLSEPETRALAEWLLARPEVFAVLAFAPRDNLTGVPEAGKMDPTGQAPISGGILDEDKPLYEWAGRVFKDATGITGVGGAGGIGGSFDGSLASWAYAQLGAASFVTPGWVRPDLGPPVEAEKPGDPPDDQTSPLVERKYPDTEDGRWLALSDRRVAAGLAAGFIDWRPFDHPQLGPVEIGGWAPGFKLDAPEAEIARAGEAQSVFVSRLLAGAPRLEPLPARVERVGARAWRVSVSARNTGTMATRTVMGVRTGRWPPTRWEIDVPPERLVAGRRSQGRARVEAGQEVAAEWVIVGGEGESVPITLRSPECGDRSLEVPLRATAGPGEVSR